MMKLFVLTSVVFCWCIEGRQIQTTPPIFNQVGGCHYGGKVYSAGQSWYANDGCNLCYCSAHAGGPECTKMNCPYTCIVNGVKYRTGDMYPASDGCNHCICSRHPSCTEIWCQCHYNGKNYNIGQTFPAMDGCNTCKCVNTNNVACTTTSCLPSNMV